MKPPSQPSPRWEGDEQKDHTRRGLAEEPDYSAGFSPLGEIRKGVKKVKKDIYYERKR